MLKTVLEVALILASVKPVETALSMKFSAKKISNVGISVTVLRMSFSMFKILKPQSFIPISVFRDMNPLPMSLRMTPLPNVAVSVTISPLARPLLRSHVPLTLVYFSGPWTPGIHPITVKLALMIAALVTMAIGEAFIATTFTHVVIPMTLEETTTFVFHNSQSMAQSFS